MQMSSKRKIADILQVESLMLPVMLQSNDDDANSVCWVDQQILFYCFLGCELCHIMTSLPCLEAQAKIDIYWASCRKYFCTQHDS